MKSLISSGATPYSVSYTHLDFVEHIYPATMHNTMMFFTQKGKCYWLKVYEIPEGTKNAKGRAIQNLLNIDSDDVVTAYLRVKNLNDTEFINSHYVLFCTKNGVIKKTLLEQYSRPRQNGVNAITIRAVSYTHLDVYKRQTQVTFNMVAQSCNIMDISR